LVGPPKGAGPAQFERLQAIYQEAHRMALGFARGRGVAVVCAHQINREGGTKVIATSEKGGKVPRFDLTHLAGSSEAERSADIVTTSYVDDRCRGKGLVLFDCLKSRHRRLFEPFLAYVDWPTRRLRSQLDLPDRTPIVPRSLFAGGSNQEPAVSNVGLQDINYGLDD
jgi:hypothetical protein